MYNKKVLSEATKNLDRTVAPAKKKDKVVGTSKPIVSTQGYKQGPPPAGTHYRIPGNGGTTSIYNPTPYPLNLVGPNGTQAQIGPWDTDIQNFNEPYIDESLAAYGGDISIPDLSQYEDGGEYDLTDDEIEQLKKGGYVVEHLPSLPKKKGSKAYSRSLTATNKLFAQNPLLKKPKSKKNKIFDPQAKQFEKGGFQDDLGKHRQLLRDWTYGQSIGMLQEAQTGEEIKNLPEITVTPGGYKGPTNLNPVNNVLFNTPQIQQNIALSKGKGPTAQGAKAIKSSKTAQDRAKFNEYANNQMQAKADWEKRSSGAAQPVDEFWTLPLAATRAPYMAGEALLGLMATELPGLAGTTVGQGLNAGFITKGILDAPSTVGAWQDVAAGKKDWKDAAEKTAWNLLDFTGAGETKEGLNLLAEDARALGKTLGTEEGLLSNAYKYNPWAFKPQIGKVYRQVGKSGFDDAVKEQKIYDKGQKEFLQNYPETDYLNEYNRAIAAKQAPGFDLRKPSPAPFFSKDELFFPINRKATGRGNQKTKYSDAEYLFEGSLPDEALLPRYRDSYNLPDDPTKTFVLRPEYNDLSNFNVYKRNWLRGYKPVSIESPGSPNTGITSNVDELVDLWRIQEKNGKTFAQLAEEGKLHPAFNNPETLARKAEEEKYFGQWFTNNKADLDWYTKDREFSNPEIINLKVPKSKLEQYNQYDKSLSRAPDREFVIPFEEQQFYKQSPYSNIRSGLGGMDMSRYEIKNPDYFNQLLDSYTSQQLSPSNKKFYKGLIDSVKKQNGLVTERQYNELQRLKSGNFNFGKKAYEDGGDIVMELTPEEIQAYRDGGYIVDELD